MRNLLEELTLAGTRVPNNTDVQVSSQLHALRSDFADTAHELKKQTFLDYLMTVDHRRQGVDQPRVDVIAVDHLLQVLNFGGCQGLQIRILSVISGVLRIDAGSLVQGG